MNDADRQRKATWTKLPDGVYARGRERIVRLPFGGPLRWGLYTDNVPIVPQPCASLSKAMALADWYRDFGPPAHTGAWLARMPWLG